MLRAFVAYCAVLGSVFFVAALGVHGLMAQEYRNEQTARLAIMVRDAEEAVEALPAGTPVQSAFASVIGAPDEGLEWRDRAGGLVARSGITTRQNVAIARARVRENDADGIAVAVISNERIADALRRLDLVVGIGMLFATLAGGVIMTAISARAVARVEEALQRVHRFTADAAHELRTPLSVIANNADELAFDVADETTGERRLLNIRGAARQMRDLMDGLLILARADEGAAVDLHSVDVEACIAGIAASYGPAAAARGIVLTARSHPRLSVYGHPEQIERIIANLVENALRYTPPGGTIEITGGMERNAAVIRVKDTGVGISGERLEKVFDRFWRGQDERASAGSGLGLAIARSLARAHGGDVTVESRLGEGSLFTVRLAQTPRRGAALSTSS